MVQQSYREALELAIHGVDDPNQDFLDAITPHLSDDDRKRVFTHPNDQPFQRFIALPPLVVFGGYLVGVYDRHQDTSFLEIHGASRHARYYDVPKNAFFQSVPFQEEALKYAETNWSDQLITDTWKNLVTVWIMDPSHQNDELNPIRHGVPSVVTMLYVALNREFEEITRDFWAPQSELWDGAIERMTLSRLEARELKAYHRGIDQENCALCGGGLGYDRCLGCGTAFPTNKYRRGNSRPLTPKMIEHLKQHGFEFRHEPTRSLQRERLDWQDFLDQLK